MKAHPHVRATTHRLHNCGLSTVTYTTSVSQRDCNFSNCCQPKPREFLERRKNGGGASMLAVVLG
eukprot:6173499-Pleurochrysis_carterae.AAC.2